MRVILDVSRLIYGVGRVAPTGIDRVEMAYARHVLAHPGGTFIAEGPWGFAAVPRARVTRLTDLLEETWATGAPPYTALKRAARHAVLAVGALAAGGGRGALRHALRASGSARPVVLLVSHRGLERPARIAALTRAGAGFVPLIHDVIPLTHPEHARPVQVRRHAQRVATVAALAEAVIVNSHATSAALTPLLASHGVPPPVLAAPLGVPATPRSVTGRMERPTFAMLSTLEPRKNHALMLALWRELAASMGPGAPRLLLLGRRGWRHAELLEMLAASPELAELVEVPGPLSDHGVIGRLAGCRALLFPSFAEGYGLPLAEALAAGLPAIASDLPALREVGGDVPDYLCPRDGAAWRAAVLDYAAPDSRRRAAQLSRLTRWRAPRWSDHFAAVDGLLERLSTTPATRAAPASIAPLPALAQAAE